MGKYFTHERGTYMGVYALFLTGSNFVAPLCSGFINYGQNWQWVLVSVSHEDDVNYADNSAVLVCNIQRGSFHHLLLSHGGDQLSSKTSPWN